MTEKATLSRSDLIATSFLVGGTCIGGGMLGLPVGSYMTGYLPSSLMLIICWFFMTLSGLLILEANLWMEEGAHMITMASKLLGPWGERLAWLLYLFISYASIVAYLAGGGSQIVHVFHTCLDIPIDRWVGILGFMCLFGPVICFGAHFVGRVNTILFLAMICAYFFMVFPAAKVMSADLLLFSDWNRSYMTIPLLLTAFSFQTIVPSLTPSLNGDGKSLRMVLVAGTTIALIVYLLWQAIVLGCIPVDGEHGLKIAYERGEPATSFFRFAVDSVWLSVVIEFFAFFALATSFLGIALGLFDFLADGLKIKKDWKGSFLIILLIALPSLLFSIAYPRVFLIAMETSGGFGDAILNGIMPVMMVWVGRYYRGYESSYPCPGGKPLLLSILFFYLFVFILETQEQLRAFGY